MLDTPTAHTPAEPRASSARRWWALLACCLAACARALTPPLWVYREPALEAFNEGWMRYNLVMSIVTVGTLAFLLFGGVLGDLFGRRRLLLAGLYGLVAANLLATLSPQPAWIFATRLLGGASSALVVPLSLSVVYLAFRDDADARTKAIAIYVAVTSMAGISAGLVGRLSYSLLGWRATIVVPTVLAILAVVLVRRTIDDSRVEGTRRFDVVGHAAWSLAALGALVGVTVSQVAGSYMWAVLAASLASVVLGGGVLVWWSQRRPGTVMGQSAIPRHALLVLIVYGVSLQIGFGSYVGLLRNVLVDVYGYNVVLAGLALAPLLLGMLVMVLAGVPRLVHVRARSVMSGALLAMSVVIMLTLWTQAAALYPWLALLLAGFGAANVAANTAWTAVFFRLVPKDAIGVRSGINSSVAQAGASIGTALSAALLASFGVVEFLRQLVVAGIDRAQRDGALAMLNSLLDPLGDAMPLEPGLGGPLIAAYKVAYVAAFDRVLLIVAAISVLGCGVVWFGLPHKERSASSVHRDD